MESISLMALVVGLVEVIKEFGIPKRWCLVASIVVGIVLLELIEATVQFPVVEPWVKAGVEGLVLGLGATGLYIVSKKFRPNSQ